MVVNYAERRLSSEERKSRVRAGSVWVQINSVCPDLRHKREGITHGGSSVILVTPVSIAGGLQCGCEVRHGEGESRWFVARGMKYNQLACVVLISSLWEAQCELTKVELPRVVSVLSFGARCHLTRCFPLNT